MSDKNSESDKTMTRDSDLAAEIASTIAQFTRAHQAGARDDHVYLAGTTQSLRGAGSRRRDDAIDTTPADDLELPDECPECGFEPEHPGLNAANGEELAAARAKRLRGEVSTWRTTGTTAEDGTHEAVTRCPDCETVVRRVEVTETSMWEVPNSNAQEE